MKVHLRNKIGMVKECKIGFSWTNLLFGWLTPLFRADYKQFAVQLVVQIFTFGLSLLVFPFIYNNLYIKGLLLSGFYPADEQSKNILIQKGFMMVENPEEID